MNENILECTAHECAFNHDGECRYQRVHDMPPRITEEKGCEVGVFELWP